MNISQAQTMQVLKVIEGTVVKGAFMGRKIGFPTINVAYVNLDMPFGIYISRVQTPLGTYKGALHFGPRLVFGIEEPSLEVFLLDFNDDLYGQKVIVEVYDKIREVRNFENLDSLKRQIRLDVECVKEADLVL